MGNLLNCCKSSKSQLESAVSSDIEKTLKSVSYNEEVTQQRDEEKVNANKDLTIVKEENSEEIKEEAKEQLPEAEKSLQEESK